MVQLKTKKIKEREKIIIQYITDNPNCSLDSIFTKGKIPKSKATKDLVERLVVEKKIYVKGKSQKKYYIEEIEETDWVKSFENMTKDYEVQLEEEPKYDNKLNRKVLEFLKYRVRVLKAEEKVNKDLDISDTLDLFYNFIVALGKNPSKLFKINVMDILNWAIKDDKYYLSHELHSNPKNRKRKFHKAIISSRRSIEVLLDMKKKGKQEYGLKGKDFKKNMKRLTNDPNVWFNRFFAEEKRTLYQNSPELKNKIRKKSLEKIKLKPNMPNYENRKKLLEASKEAFPDIPIAVIFDIMSKETKAKVREQFKEMGEDFDLFEKQIRKMKTFGESDI